MDLRAAARFLPRVRMSLSRSIRAFSSTASEAFAATETGASNTISNLMGSQSHAVDLSDLERLGKQAQSIRNAQKELQNQDTYTRFPGSDYQAYVHTSKYAKWLNGPRRRESWTETVGRYFDFMEEHLRDQQSYIVPKEQRRELEGAVLSLEVMPSMRALMTAGPALKKSGIAGYNCSYVPIDSLEAFHEILYILMHGTGVGFSVERQFTDQLPVVPHNITDSSTAIHIGDSREGWAEGLRQLLRGLYAGTLRPFDTSDVRPEGAILQTFGGLASGPAPLHELHAFAEKVFREARGRRLTPLECHDLVCKIGESVVVGGVRRSALISLSDLSDNDMRDCKAGAWWERNSSRYMANNSAVYTETPTRERFDEEWAALVASGSGERGLFSRAAAAQQAARFRGRRTEGIAFGTNPCSEIILRPQQFCNLSEVVVRAGDSMEDLLRKVRVATTLGTWQATLTHWKEGGEGLRAQWRQNTVEERLLGVSLTGIMDNELTSGQRGRETLIAALQSLRSAAAAENATQAGALGIATSAAVTCVKPSGTVSQLVDAASGIHPRHSKHYIRRVRGNNGDPLSQFLSDSGVPSEPCAYSPGSQVFSFPVASPKSAMVRDDMDALSHMQLCLDYQRHWCEHKPSVTISVRDSEWKIVGDWVYKHFEELAGVSFLPYDTGTYQQTPYETIEEEEYNKLCEKMPETIDWAAFQAVERGWRDFKVGGDLACSTGECEVVGEPVDTTHVATGAEQDGRKDLTPL